VNRAGALTRITGALREGGFTLLNSLNRVQEHRGYSWFEAIIAARSWRESNRTRKPQEEIRQALSVLNGDGLDIQILFDRESASKQIRRAEAPRRLRPTVAERHVEVDDWLLEKQQRLEDTVDRGPGAELAPTARTEAHRRYRSALQVGMERVQRATGRRQNRLFLSIEFNELNEQRINLVRDSCSDRNLILDVVRKSEGEPIIWQEVVARITRANLFLAIWTPSLKGGPGEHGGRPSPWCTWELGVANALGVSMSVFIQDGMDTVDYRAIHGNEFYRTFDGRDPEELRNNIGEAIDHLLQRRAGSWYSRF